MEVLILIGLIIYIEFLFRNNDGDYWQHLIKHGILIIGLNRFRID